MADLDNEDGGRSRDRALGMHRHITRRDFLNGMAVGVGGVLANPWIGGLLSAQTLTASAQDRRGYYPPTLNGMRGSHPGAFEVAHSLRDGTFWEKAGKPVETGEEYDLVVVGGGIGGLAAAYFYRKQAGPSVRILILDNHDDFGGHAKRDEFHIGGRMLLTNGGTVSIESPFPYSKEARGLLAELGIDPPALQKKYENDHASSGLGFGYFFSKETFGTERLVTNAPGGFYGRQGASSKWAEFLARTPLSAQAQQDIVRIQEAKVDYMEGVPQEQKKSRLSKMSYKDFLLNVVKAHPDVIAFYQSRTHGLYGIGIDAVPALDCWAIHFPGFQGMGLDRVPSKGLTFTALGEVTPQEEFHFHFPDGNASIARMLVRSLVPGSAPGNTAEDIVTASMDYGRLDHVDSAVRIRLNSTAVLARHVGDSASAKQVEVVYGRDQKAYSVRGKAAVLACWNMVIPYLCPDLPAEQKDALHYGVKVPLVYSVVGLRNWTAFHKLGLRGVSCPGMYHTSMNLDQAAKIGEYKPPESPDEPILVHMLRTPCQPGLSAREQQRAGHYELLATPFETFERNIRDQLVRVLGSGGFDPARDIEAITVNRWPHGYAYEYNPLWDPDWPEGKRPCDIARQRFGRITIANSDAAAAAYTDQAIDQSYRAVQELLSS
ncbi:MAG TPA: NAD(P)-binding protein [Candidatus Acidoferrales bacterium]|nr:NAD(P)-binding protein [Candidatus Acidoferrales bacterium]